MRTERDFIGTKELPQDALYGIQSARAAENFALHHREVHPELIRAMVTVKKAAALTYRKLGIGMRRCTTRFFPPAKPCCGGVHPIIHHAGAAGRCGNLRAYECQRGARQSGAAASRQRCGRV
jgi:hypothetical protein